MFELKFAKMYDNTIFTRYGVKPVEEDYYKVKEKIFCIADGVTRDSIYGEAIPYPKNKKEVEQWIEVYPNPSGAYEAAKICVEQFVKYVSEEVVEDKEVLFEIVKKVNKEIAKINEKRNINYLANDLFCCVAVGGKITDDKLYCFSIGDCHIITLDDKCNVEFSTINNHLQFENYLNNEYCKTHEFDWNKSEDRIMVRKDYRNKPDMKYNGQEVSFGVLSGENEAEHYIETYEVELTKVKYICAYSDGCEPFFKTRDTIEEIIKNPDRIQDEGKERTLIIYERK